MEAFTFIFRSIKNLAVFLDTPIITYNDIDISLLDIDLVFLVIGLVAAVFWRGART